VAPVTRMILDVAFCSAHDETEKVNERRSIMPVQKKRFMYRSSGLYGWEGQKEYPDCIIGTVHTAMASR
jgi:hypothetical protein